MLEYKLDRYDIIKISLKHFQNQISIHDNYRISHIINFV